MCLRHKETGTCKCLTCKLTCNFNVVISTCNVNVFVSECPGTCWTAKTRTQQPQEDVEGVCVDLGWSQPQHHAHLIAGRPAEHAVPHLHRHRVPAAAALARVQGVLRVQVVRLADMSVLAAEFGALSVLLGALVAVRLGAGRGAGRAGRGKPAQRDHLQQMVITR